MQTDLTHYQSTHVTANATAPTSDIHTTAARMTRKVALMPICSEPARTSSLPGSLLKNYCARQSCVKYDEKMLMYSVYTALFSSFLSWLRSLRFSTSCQEAQLNRQ